MSYKQLTHLHSEWFSCFNGSFFDNLIQFRALFHYLCFDYNFHDLC